MIEPSDYRTLAQELRDILGLAVSPVAITFHRSAPHDIKRFEKAFPPSTADGRTGPVPAGCVFWVEAIDKTFATVPEDHGNCSVGCVTHGLKTLPEVANNSDVVAACEVGWVTAEAVGGLTVIAEKPGCIEYGPLSEASGKPSIVLLRLNGKQQMFLHDAWPDVRLEGKPQCHIIAIAKERGEIAMSVGCMLSRVRTGMSNNEVTCAIPSDILPTLLERLRSADAANMAVAAYAAQDSKRFSSPGPSTSN
jgi:uncharacterized protein (DUF169 family)